MQVPAAMFIESAVNSLKTDLPAWMRPDQIKELHSAVGAVGEDFDKGYELGLQTARIVIACSSALLLKGVDPKDVL